VTQDITDIKKIEEKIIIMEATLPNTVFAARYARQMLAYARTSQTPKTLGHVQIKRIYCLCDN